MRLHFDYNEVDPETIKQVVDFFYKRYQKDHLQFGAVSVYIAVRDRSDNSSIGWFDQKTGKETELYIKPQPIKNTKKQLLGEVQDVDDETGEITTDAYIYLKA